MTISLQIAFLGSLIIIIVLLRQMNKFLDIILHTLIEVMHRDIRP